MITFPTKRRIVFILCLLTGLLLSACAPIEQPPAPTPTPAARIAPSLALPRVMEPSPTAGPETISGLFEISNTSPDIPEVLVESMQMLFEFQAGQNNPWQALASECAFDPAVPLLVRETQAVAYECQLAKAVPPGAELRAAVEIRLMGSDQVFRMQVEAPR